MLDEIVGDFVWVEWEHLSGRFRVGFHLPEEVQVFLAGDKCHHLKQFLNAIEFTEHHIESDERSFRIIVEHFSKVSGDFPVSHSHPFSGLAFNSFHHSEGESMNDDQQGAEYLSKKLKIPLTEAERLLNNLNQADQEGSA